MNRINITENVKRRLYAESMGKCMNPACQEDLFVGSGDITEKAHIVAYCKTADNAFENLVILCPNCHTKYDSCGAFSPDEIRGWKRIRKAEMEKIFAKKFSSFDELRREVSPLLEENRSIYEQYFLGDARDLWDRFEPRILANNRKLKMLLENNLDLIQDYRAEAFSNREIVRRFLLHVDEFEATRGEDEKVRKVLFPDQINSIFGVAPVHDDAFASTESLEALKACLEASGCLLSVDFDPNDPSMCIQEDGKPVTVYLSDSPRLRQLCHNYSCFRRTGVRLKDLLYFLRYLRRNQIPYDFSSPDSFRNITIYGQKTELVYEYCLSCEFLRQLAPEEGSAIVNLHTWNGSSCISKDACALAREMNVTLLTSTEFYRYVQKRKYERGGHPDL